VAGETVLALTFANGSYSPQFDSVFARSAAQQIAILSTSPTPSYAQFIARITCRTNDIWPGNNTVMCLLADTDSDETTGQTYYFSTDRYIPSGTGNFTVDTQLLWELHHGYQLYTLSGAASIAPYAIFYHDPDEIRFRIATGNAWNGSSFNGGYAHQELNISLLPSPPRDTWIQFIVKVDAFSETSGNVAVWVDPTGTGTFVEGSPDLSRVGIPTIPFAQGGGVSVHNLPLYTQLGQYAGYAPTSATNISYTTGSYRSLSFADAVTYFTGAAPSGPTNLTLPVITGSTVVGQTLTCSTGTWSGGPTSYTYQWKRDNQGGGIYTNIGGAQASVYVLTNPDSDCNIACAVTAHN
jgi:hypothetical protein